MPGAAQERVMHRTRKVAQEFSNNIAISARPVIAGFQADKAVSTALDSDIIRGAIKQHQAKLRAYRHKAINGIGKPETVAAGIKRAQDEIERLSNLL